jgi:hypothetical protein
MTSHRLVFYLPKVRATFSMDCFVIIKQRRQEFLHIFSHTFYDLENSNSRDDKKPSLNVSYFLFMMAMASGLRADALLYFLWLSFNSGAFCEVREFSEPILIVLFLHF